LLDEARSGAEPGSQRNLDHRAAEVPGPGRRFDRSRRRLGSPAATAKVYAGLDAEPQPPRVYLSPQRREKEQPARPVAGSVSASQRAIRMEAHRERYAAATSG